MRFFGREIFKKALFYALYTGNEILQKKKQIKEINNKKL